MAEEAQATIVADDAAATADATVDTAVTDTTQAADTAATTNDTDTTAKAANDDWRTEWAGEDPELLKFLGRYHSRDAAVKAWKKTNDELKSGKYLKPLPESPTDEELASYRKDNGIPEKPEGYLETLGDGLVVGEDDRPYVDAFLAKMHGANAKPAEVNAALSAYYDIVDEQVAKQSEAAAQAKEASVEALREEWGGDYKRNVNVVNSFLSGLPEPVRNAIAAGRDDQNMPLGNNAEFIKWLAGLALEANPIATVVPGAGSNQASAIADEIAAIEKTMRENRGAYNRDEKMQARYRELINAQLKLEGKG